MGRRSHHSVGLSVVGKWRATSTASADGVVGLPSRSVARSGLLVRVPYKAACRLIDCPPTEGMTSPGTLAAGIGGVTPAPSGSWDSPGLPGRAERGNRRAGYELMLSLNQACQGEACQGGTSQITSPQPDSNPHRPSFHLQQRSKRQWKPLGFWEPARSPRQILSAIGRSSSFWGKFHLMCLVQAGLLAKKLPPLRMLLCPLPEETRRP